MRRQSAHPESFASFSFSFFTACALAALVALAACGDDDDGDDDGPTPDAGAPTAAYALASVVIDGDNRTTYVQVLPGLPTGHVTNTAAIEIAGNGVMLTQGRNVFVGLAEEPTWVRYTVGADGAIAESGRLSFANLGLAAIDYGNTIVDATTAVSVASAEHLAIVWNPTTMTITGTVDLPHLAPADAAFATEVWTTLAHDGKVYIPGRWADWTHGAILAKVQMTIFDPVARKVVAVAEDDRCASGGRAVFGKDGHLYVMGDGRNYAAQMYANAAGTPAPKNCLLRIKSGATDFDPDFHVEIPALTGGYESVGELETAVQGSGLAFSKLFYPAELPDGVEPTSFDFWGYPAFKMWRIELGDEPKAVVVEGAPFSTIGFEGSEVGGKLYSGEASEAATSKVYEIDPQTNVAVEKFTMDGYFYGLNQLD